MFENMLCWGGGASGGIARAKRETIARRLHCDFHLQSFTHERRITGLNVARLQIRRKSRRKRQIISDEQP